ncbi:MAG: copper chaperone PCu(A)C [Mycetocola sp.]
MRISHLSIALTAAAGVLLLTSCSAGTAPTTETTTSAPAAEQLTVTDAWVKSAEDGMSAAFGELSNTGDSEITLVSVTTPASSDVELHETVENESGAMVMREKSGGFSIGAGDSLDLEPGGNHIMLMGLNDPILAGDEVTFELEFSDGSHTQFSAPVKDYSGANENYEGGDEHAEHGTESGTDSTSSDEGSDTDHAEHAEHN